MTDLEDFIDLRLVMDLFIPFFEGSPALEGVLAWKTSEGALLKAGGCCCGIVGAEAIDFSLLSENAEFREDGEIDLGEK